ncbi:tryptophan synthase subunit alpha [Pistricoccus aurantiacus]|uniref:Tryptophan synthase alpha chain n=1 Tax=Pistricoccus aurantiacus TaxID=1883414 RepID=A0A5B8SW33_9GAMM|nr:tryptophan synthase subunit alpha [Pistricoccus aurantiacus]QEA40354.1 tryptophan synthase subunit alpha [Pistricoccus aurantiacus]
MNRIDQRFAALKRQGRKALIPYITAGDPTPRHTVGFMQALVKAGADIIELGMPFSDPMADGPVIQKACERALKQGTRLSHLFEMVSEFRQSDQETPVVLMGYLNPIERLGYERFADLAREAGVDGVLMVDMPPEEADQLGPIFKERGLATIFLVAPTTSESRAATIVAQAQGYIYYVSLKGVTGAATLDVASIERHLAPLREMTALPLCVGFGIRDGETAAAVAQVADGVIVGSALVNHIAAGGDDPASIPPRLKAVLGEMRQAMDA